MAFLKPYDIYKLGIKRFGEKVLISDKCSIYGAEHIEIGDNVRIDDFCILSAGKFIRIGNNVHIACYTSLIGKGEIIVKDWVDISMKNTIMSSTSDPHGDYLTSPVVPPEMLNTRNAPIVFERYSVLYAMSMVLPGVTVGEGAVVGAMSLVKQDIPAWQIWAGNPIHMISPRKQGLLKLVENG